MDEQHVEASYTITLFKLTSFLAQNSDPLSACTTMLSHIVPLYVLILCLLLMSRERFSPVITQIHSQILHLPQNAAISNPFHASSTSNSHTSLSEESSATLGANSASSSTSDSEPVSISERDQPFAFAPRSRISSTILHQSSLSTGNDENSSTSRRIRVVAAATIRPGSILDRTIPTVAAVTTSDDTSTTTLKCFNSGIPKNEKCECSGIFYGDRCENIKQCSNDRVGFTCRCDADTVCLPPPEDPTTNPQPKMECDKSLIPASNKTLECSTTSDVKSFFGEHAVVHCSTVVWDTTESRVYAESVSGQQEEATNVEVGSCSLTLFHEREKPSVGCEFHQCEATFRREGSSASKIPQENYVGVRCQKAFCACPGDESSMCSSYLEPYFKDLKGTGAIHCDKTEGTCTMEHEALPLSLEFESCMAGKCVLANQTGPPVPVHRNTMTAGEKAGIIVSAVLLALMIASFTSCCCVLCVSHYRHKKRVSIEWQKWKNRTYGGYIQVKKLSYSVREWSLRKFSLKKKKILSKLSTAVAPGKMVCILGASGSGKTTLLDLLANRRKTGRKKGKILLDGKLQGQKAFHRKTGLVFQDDLMFETLTVRETLRFVCDIRLPECVRSVEKNERISEVLNDLAIVHVQHTKIGRLSGGERRRVSLAVELLVEPAVIFCDEVTSGLDASTAYTIVQALRSLVDRKGRTIVITIHQPRANILSMFDEMILMSKGHMVYSGPIGGGVNHFESLSFVKDPTENPADFIIDCMNHLEQAMQEEARRQKKPISEILPDFKYNYKTKDASSEESVTKLPHRASEAEGEVFLHANEMNGQRGHQRNANSGGGEVSLGPVSAAGAAAGNAAYRHSIIPQRSQRISPSISSPEEEQEHRQPTTSHRHPKRVVSDTVHMSEEETLNVSVEEALTEKYASSFATQLWALSKRTTRNFFRSIMMLPAHLIGSILIGLALGVFFMGQAYNIAGTQSRMGVLFFTMFVLAFIAVSNLNLFIQEKKIFARETASGWYNPIAYLIPKILIDLLPLRLLPPLIMGSIAYWLVGLNPSASSFGFFLLILVLFNFSSGALGIMISVASPTISFGLLLSVFFILGNCIFAGYLVNRNGFPVWVQWIQHLSYWSYTYEALMVNEFRNVEILVDETSGFKVTGEFWLEKLGMSVSAFTLDLIMIVVYGIVFLLIASGLLFFVREKR